MKKTGIETRRKFQARVMTTFMTALSVDTILASSSSEVKGIDSHAHIFSRRLKLAEVHRYVPDYDATLKTYLSLLRAHGLSGAVLIQPSFLGTDNSFLLSALKGRSHILRGVVVIDPAIDLRSLEQMKRAGAVGIRLNLFGFPDPDLSGLQWQRVLGKVKELDWQVEVHAEAHRLPALLKPLLRTVSKIVVDHFGRPDPALGTRDPGFQYLLSTADTRRVWVKISGTYRNGPNGVGERIALEAVPILKHAFSLDRMLWGSDWPHTQFEDKVNYETAFQFLLKMLPKEQEREVVLKSAPAALFGFQILAPV